MPEAYLADILAVSTHLVIMPSMKASRLNPSGIVLIIITLAIIVIAIACRSDPQTTTPPTLTHVPTQTSVLPASTATVEKRIPTRRSGDRPYSPYLELSLIRANTEPTSLQMPAAIEATLAGREIISVTLLVGRYERSGARRLVTSLPVRRQVSPGTPGKDWPDGIHDLIFVWETEGDYLSDGTGGDFVLLQELDPLGELWAVNGRFRPSGIQQFENVELQINRRTSVVERIFSQQSGEKILPGQGDEFQILDYYLDDSGAVTNEPGLVLKFDDSGQLAYRRLPLTQDDYFLSYVASAVGGITASITVDFLVGNENLLPGRQAYFQPQYGFQFLYPEEWSELVPPAGQILSTNVTPTMTLQIAIDPLLEGGGRGIGQQAILRSFGDIEVLYEDQFEMGLHGGLRTVYGYESTSGPRTGVLLTFSYDGRNFVIDVDGPAENEQQVVLVAQSLLDSWIWRSLPETPDGSSMHTLAIEDYNITVPIDYQYDSLKNGWQRLSDNKLNAFLAFRFDAATDTSPEGRLLYWENVARRDVSNYFRSDMYEQELAGRAWRRIDFQYDSEDLGEIWGAILSSVLGDGHFIAWLEAPASDFMRLEEEQLSLLLATLVGQQ